MQCVREFLNIGEKSIALKKILEISAFTILALLKNCLLPSSLSRHCHKESQ